MKYLILSGIVVALVSMIPIKQSNSEVSIVKKVEPIRELAEPTTKTMQPVKRVEPKPTPEPPQEPVAVVNTCADEIRKYDWNHATANAVMLAESSGDPNTVNNNPATGDYSIGCFQVNLYGANAYSRPSESELKNPAVNVAWSYNNYKANGSSFIGQWGVCVAKVQCY